MLSCCVVLCCCVVLLLCCCVVKVGDLHMDMGEFPGKEAHLSVEQLLDSVGHKFTMVS